jgi:sialidase-1
VFVFAVALGLLGCRQVPLSENVFVSGSLDPLQAYAVYRIPVLSRTRFGTLLAFAEARKSIGDQSSNVLVLRRKVRRSRSWSNQEVVAHDDMASLNNPCVLATNRLIWLMYQRYPAGLNERTTSFGFDPEKTCRSFVISSVDDGKTWSSPVELTSTIKRRETRSLASGPGIGIELKRGAHAGRLLFPFNEGANGIYDAFAVYSDDNGRTWHRGMEAPKPSQLQPNETQFVELSDGDVMLNARNQASDHHRLESVSHDGGETWDTVRPIPDLVDPVCMGSIVRVSFDPNLMAFSNPADARRRVNGTVRLSSDDGKSWTILREVTDATSSFEYSCLCPLSSSQMGLIYETREVLPSGTEGYRIRYMTLALK